jgi:hypothetical protein
MCFCYLAVRTQMATTYVTEIITDYKGYWQNSTGLSANAPTSLELPDNSQQLLAFTLNGQRFSTGVNNQLLTAKGLPYTPSQYQALPVATYLKQHLY